MHFCIVGTGRCGTSLLRRIFNNHPDVFVFNETHWILKMHEMYGESCLAEVGNLISIVNSTFHITGNQVTDIDDKTLVSLFDSKQRVTVREFCNTLGIHLANKNRKIIWADKTPDYGPFMHLIQRTWPKCKFIHVIRHGADVALSMSKHPGYRWLATANEDSWATVAYNKYYKSVRIKKQPMEVYSSLWYRRLQRIQDESKQLTEGSYCEIRFEDFIKNPYKILNDLTEFVNIRKDNLWIQNSKDMIDLDRMKNWDNNLKFLNRREIKLLDELGYKI